MGPIRSRETRGAGPDFGFVLEGEEPPVGGSLKGAARSEPSTCSCLSSSDSLIHIKVLDFWTGNRLTHLGSQVKWALCGQPDRGSGLEQLREKLLPLKANDDFQTSIRLDWNQNRLVWTCSVIK